MKCDENEDIKFVSADKVNACTVEYHFNSKYACQSSGIKLGFSFVSDGSMFTPKNILITSGLIMFFYFILFTYFNYKRNPEDGLIKSLPNREFWSNFFENISVGCNATSNCFKAKLFGRSDNNNNDLI